MTAIPTLACDDTLVMLLTAKNPNSEFSKTIRAFTSSLNELGLALKHQEKSDFSPEVQKTMQAWMEFTTRYMTNPPEEAKNDNHWLEKMHDTSKRIGEIRKKVSGGEFTDAHNLVLDLSSRIGTFFEAVGISDEKQLFVDASTNLTILENMILMEYTNQARASVASLTTNLADFEKMLPAAGKNTADNLKTRLEDLKSKILPGNELKKLDPEVLEIKAMFEELRSHILMKEWFPETLGTGKDKTDDSGNRH
jgi:hypothetical protein